MTTPSIKSPFRSHCASEFSLSTLRRVWNDVYAEYFVPMEWSDAQFAQHVTAHDVALRRSLVWMDGLEPVAMSLAAIRGDRAWIGGFGLVPRFRGGGLAQPLFEEHLRLVMTVGVTRIQLEVIDRNHAKKVYERAGFETARRLMLFRIEEERSPVHEGVTDVGEALRVSRLLDAKPSWQGEHESVEKLAGLGKATAVVIGERAAAVIGNLPAAARVIHAAAADRESAAELLEAITAAHGSVMIVNEPEGSPIAGLLCEGGNAPFLEQWEMTLERKRL